MQELKSALKAAVNNLFDVEVEPELTRPEEQFGDFATNIALQLAKQLGKNPREVAEAIVDKLKNLPILTDVQVAGPGFINLKLTDETLAKMAFSATDLPKPNTGQVIVLEHTDPNPFKEFHIGHAYSNTVGVATGRLLEASGAQVHQVSYHGDVGLHIAMAVWAIQKEGFDSESLRQRLLKNIGFYYAKGAQAYHDDPVAKREIEEINKHIYARDNPSINQIYDAGRDGSLKHFEYIYKRLGSKFEKNYFESETAIEGEKIVKEYIGKVFEESDGAIVYDGEKAGLHKRVFITGQGLPTYEAKEIGLAFAKQRDYPDAQKFIVITANEIDDYFRVLITAIKEIDAGLGEKIIHLSHGVVKFPEGKMSSRTGNVKLFSSLEVDIEEALKELYKTDSVDISTVLGAIKYEFLKHRLGSDFIFDVGESISLEGNSGPYLQYAHARARSILKKSRVQSPESIAKDSQLSALGPGERSLARKIGEYPEVVAKASDELMPHHICTYLYELAQSFNSFYEKNRVLDNARQNIRLRLVKAYADVLKNGLNLLNIASTDKM
jgi:arginyl-tRNA synthetase